GPRSPENRISQLNKRICTLKEQKAKTGPNEYLDNQIEELKDYEAAKAVRLEAVCLLKLFG
ncbi:7570_t:CDS:2, partial [Gigaspora rosea]